MIKNMHASIIGAACALVCLASQAAPLTVPAGQNLVVTDPSSGRQGNLMFQAGTGELVFSPGSTFDGTDPGTVSGVVGALSVTRTEIEAIDPPMYQASYQMDNFGDLHQVGAQLRLPVASVTLDDVSGGVLSLAAPQDKGFTMTAPRIFGTLTGGTATVSNLRFDLANRVVYADLVGRSAAVGTSKPATDYVSLNTALWTIGAVSGPAAIPLDALLSANSEQAMRNAGFRYYPSPGLGLGTFAAENVLSGLRITEQGFDFLRQSLGLLPTGVAAYQFANQDPLGWGSMTLTTAYIGPVPEPQGVALAVAGLAVVGAVARRRRQPRPARQA